MEHETLATELLHEIKASARRWFIAFVVMCVLEVSTVAGFLWYMSLPTEETNVSVENEGGNASYIGRDMNGVLENGTGQSELQETDK